MEYSFEILTTAEAMLPYYALIKQLQPNLKYAWYEKSLVHMTRFGYRMVIIKEKGKVAGLSGIWVVTKLYCGKYIEMDNVVVDEKHRGKGIGKLLTDKVVEIGRNEDCRVVMLDAYLENTGAHSFYEREGFIRKGFHFIRKL